MPPSSGTPRGRNLIMSLLLLGGVALFIYRTQPLSLQSSNQQQPHIHQFTGSSMGTTFSVKVAAGELSEARKTQLQKRIEGHLAEIDSLMSHYRDDSELSRFNRHATDQPFPVSHLTLEVFALAEQVATRSGGALDITVAPLVNAWGIGPKERGDPPSNKQIETLLQRIGHAKIIVNNADRTLRKTQPTVTADLSAVAKGYAVDHVAEGLVHEGLRDFLVELGGEVRALGHKAPDEPWRVGIEVPAAGVQVIQQALSLTNLAMATSGDYRNFYDLDGKRMSHTIDPRSGRPAAHNLASVTVVAGTCAEADAWATALNVLGPEEGPAVAQQQKLAAQFVIREADGSFSVFATPAFELLRDP